MEAVHDPLLRTRFKTSKHTRFYFVAFFLLFFGFGFWEFVNQEKGIRQQRVGIEKEGTNLPGCKVVTGDYIEHYKGFLSKEVHLAQKACQGIEVQHGARFTVFGSTIRMADRIGDIAADGSVILWPDGQKWTRLKTTAHPVSTTGSSPGSVTTTKKPAGSQWCENIEGSYREYDENSKLTTKFVNYVQSKSSCTGQVMKKLNLPVNFEIKENIISMDWNGHLLEGEINHADKSILWTNGYKHVSNSDLGAGDIGGVLQSLQPAK